MIHFDYQSVQMTRVQSVCTKGLRFISLACAATRFLACLARRLKRNALRLFLVGPSFRGEFAVVVGARDTAVHEEIAAGDERTVRAHQERADGSDFVRSTTAAGR